MAPPSFMLGHLNALQFPGAGAPTYEYGPAPTFIFGSRLKDK